MHVLYMYMYMYLVAACVLESAGTVNHEIHA